MTIRAALTEATTDLYVHDGDDNYRPLDLDVDAILAHPAMRPIAELLEGRTVEEVAEKVALAEAVEALLTSDHGGDFVIKPWSDGEVGGYEVGIWGSEHRAPTLREAIEEALR